jgi:hypothetical protein
VAFVEMQNPASLVLDDEKAIQHSECHRRHGEEIEGRDYLAVILEKDEAPLAGITAPNHMTADIGPPFVPRGKSPASAVPRESWERPTRVLVRQASDQIPDLSRDPWPSAARTLPPAPVESKTGAMPADHSLGFDNEEDLGSAGPEAAESHPEQPVASVRGGQWCWASAALRNEARANGAALVDIHGLTAELQANGVVEGGQHLTPWFLGGLFSLDGVHPSNTGYALFANEFITTLNTTFAAGIPLVSVREIEKNDPLVLPGVGQPPSAMGQISPESAKLLRAILAHSL